MLSSIVDPDLAEIHLTAKHLAELAGAKDRGRRVIRAHRWRHHAEVLPCTSPQHPAIDQHVRGFASRVVDPELFQELPGTGWFVIQQGVPRQQRAYSTSGGATQPGNLVSGQFLRAKQPFKYARGESGVAASALTGDHDAAQLLTTAFRPAHGPM